MMADFGITAQGPTMFYLSGELDMATVPIMNVAIADAVSRGGPITIDMTDLTFMDSSGVGAIVRSVQTLPTGCIVLHGAHDGVGKVLDLMGVDRDIANLHRHPVPGRRRSSEEGFVGFVCGWRVRSFASSSPGIHGSDGVASFR